MSSILRKTKEICELYGIRPARSRGQNFLIRPDHYESIIEAADLSEDDNVLEVGPGLGFLTALLSKRAGQVVSVELDTRIASILKAVVSAEEVPNLRIIEANALDVNTRQISTLFGQPADDFHYKIVANLPYNITSAFLRHYLEGVHKPDMFVLMLQKEVAERIAAGPGEMSLLAHSVQFYADVEIVAVVQREAFWPVPAVDSAIIRILRRPLPLLSGEEARAFFRLLKIGFAQKRKMLRNNLANGLHLPAEEVSERLFSLGIPPTIRAQDLSQDNWVAIMREFKTK